MAYPHTSSWDFVVGIVAKWAIGLPVAFLGKDSLFQVPVFGRFMRWCGGIPVRRDSANGLIAYMARRMTDGNTRGARWWLAVAPEGTRKASNGWHAGFYHMACTAQVPIGLAYFNFARKEIGVTHYLMPSGNAEADLRQIARWYADHAVGIAHVFMPTWRVSPFVGIGGGVISISPKATLVQAEDRTDTTAYAGLGVRGFLTNRFLLQAEYRSYVVFTSRDENEEIDAWTVGFTYFF